jgi:hypothetical protein
MNISKELGKLFGVLALSDHEDEASRQDRREQKEDKFKLILTRLSGETNAVTIDDMCEFMAFVQNNGVHDLSFVDEGYRASVFSDDEFLDKTGIIVCSVEQFVSTWEDAKEKKEATMLILFRDAHRKARTFLADPDVKKRIKDCHAMRDQVNLYKDYCDMLLMSVRFVRTHLRNPVTDYLMRSVIPNLSGLANEMNFPFLITNSSGSESPRPPAVEDHAKVSEDTATHKIKTAEKASSRGSSGDEEPSDKL